MTNINERFFSLYKNTTKIEEIQYYHYSPLANVCKRRENKSGENLYKC